MTVIIAGSRDLTNPQLIEDAIRESGFVITEVIHGAARGVDTMAENWAKKNKIPFRGFKAEWNKYDKAAGGMRNERMATESGAQALIAIRLNGSESKGTTDMIKRAKHYGLEIYVKELTGELWPK